MFDCGIDGGDIMPTMGPSIDPQVTVPVIQYSKNFLELFLTSGSVDNTSLIVYVFDKHESRLCSACYKRLYKLEGVKGARLYFDRDNNCCFKMDENKTGHIKIPLNRNEIAVIVTAVTTNEETMPLTLLIRWHGKDNWRGGDISVTEISRRGF